jgi:DNA-binding transcriptional regulator YhcF (GntR family)
MRDVKIIGDIAAALDRRLPVPLGVQLRGLIEYGMACGELAFGTRLPSVRDMAQASGLAPMTVAGVYRDLRAAGLITTRPGSGTFVANSARTPPPPRAALTRLHARIDDLLVEADAARLSRGELAALVTARLGRKRARERPVHLMMVGVFRSATLAYAEAIALQLRAGDTIEAATVSELRAAPAVVPDLYVTLANRVREVEAISAGRAPVVSLSFIPSEATRALLAAIDPLANVCVVSRFPEFLALMKPGVLRFVPHVPAVEALVMDRPDLAQSLRRADVVVYSTGAEAVVDSLAAAATAIEYRHMPDPHAIQRFLLPMVERIRSGMPFREVRVENQRDELGTGRRLSSS